MGRELLAVDFDKTLTDPDTDEWSEAHKQEPNSPVIEAVQNAYRNGHQVIIWTARKWREAPKIVGWLTIHEVPYHGLKCGKGGADEYVDDKAVTPKEFVGDETIMRVGSPEPPDN